VTLFNKVFLIIFCVTPTKFLNKKLMIPIFFYKKKSNNLIFLLNLNYIKILFFTLIIFYKIKIREKEISFEIVKIIYYNKIYKKLIYNML